MGRDGRLSRAADEVAILGRWIVRPPCRVPQWVRSRCGSSEKTLAERWDGLSWMVDPTPTPPFWRCASYGGGNSVSTDVRLAGVSCRLGTTCMAVGVISSTDCGARDAVAIIATCAGADDPLVEVRTAGQWSIETTRLDQGPVNAVSCVSQVCTVVGEGRLAASTANDGRWSGPRRATGPSWSSPACRAWP